MQVRGVSIEREAISKAEANGRFITGYGLMTFAEVLGVSMGWLMGKASKGNAAHPLLG